MKPHHQWQTSADEVAVCTVEAAHRRDHQHVGVDDECHPHVIEVVRLGERAVMVCHDCRTDSGFIPPREADHLAYQHRQETLAEPAWRSREVDEYVS